MIFVTDNLKEAFQKRFPNIKTVSIKFLFKNSRIFRKANILNFLKIGKIKREKCDLMIYPYINKYVKILKNVKNIITIHDLIPLDNIKDKNSTEYKKLKNETENYINKTKFVVTISNYSKNKIKEVYPNYEGEVIVIPNSIEKLEKSNKKAQDILGKDTPYIFSINSFFKHKNQITLLKAFNEIKEKIPHDLVLVRKTRARFSY